MHPSNAYDEVITTPTEKSVRRAVAIRMIINKELGGVLGAMDTMYQRSKIQDGSMYYEHRKHDGSLPIIGVNTFLGGKERHAGGGEVELVHSTGQEKETGAF